MDENIHSDSYLEHHPRVKLFLLSLLLIFALILGFSTYAAAKLKQPFKEDAQTQVIDISKGSSSRQIAASLEKEKIITNDRVFLYYLWIKGAREKIQAGSYELSASMTIPEIVGKLTKGEVVPNEIRFRIGEGWNLDRIAAQVEESGLGTREDFFKLAGSVPSFGNRAANPDIINRYEFLKNLPSGATLEIELPLFEITSGVGGNRGPLPGVGSLGCRQGFGNAPRQSGLPCFERKRTWRKTGIRV